MADAETFWDRSAFLDVCSRCGDPVETIPCSVHQPDAWLAWDSNLEPTGKGSVA